MAAKKKSAQTLRRKRQIKGKKHRHHVKVYLSLSEKTKIEAHAASMGESASSFFAELAYKNVKGLRNDEQDSEVAAQ